MEREKKSRPVSATGEHVNKKLKLSPNKIKLSVGDTVIVADKQTLMEASPYFASLLRFHAEDDLQVVSLVPPDNADPNCFLAMLNSLISTSLKLMITEENLWDCIVLSKYFQAECIEEDCWEALRKMLPTLPMDELLRLWRHGHACAIEKATTLALVGISFKMDTASESTEFLDLSPDELVALMSDDGFLPVLEENICEAVRAWCEHDPENRKNNDDVLKRVVAELVWDEVTEPLIRSISPHCKAPGKMPKRTVISDDDYEFPDAELLKEVNGSAGIIIRNCLYFLRKWDYSDEDYDTGHKSFCRMDMNSREQEELHSMDIEELKFIPEDGPKVDECGVRMSLCCVRLAGCDKIGCFGSNSQFLNRKDDEEVCNVTNIISLYDIAANKWQKLPCLPLPRTYCDLIQCDSFLYIIGGKEHKALDEDGEDALHCYRLDFIKLTADPEERGTRWERIAELNAPRILHETAVQYGRIMVYEAETVTKDGETIERWSRWCEAYDPTLNYWNVGKRVEEEWTERFVPGVACVEL